MAGPLPPRTCPPSRPGADRSHPIQPAGHSPGPMPAFGTTTRPRRTAPGLRRRRRPASGRPIGSSRPLRSGGRAARRTSRPRPCLRSRPMRSRRCGQPLARPPAPPALRPAPGCQGSAGQVHSQFGQAGPPLRCRDRGGQERYMALRCIGASAPGPSGGLPPSLGIGKQKEDRGETRA